MYTFMKTIDRATQARRELDRRLADLQAAPFARPHAGWIRAVRDALGMSQAALAARVGVSAAAISQLEASETRGGISLAKLAQVAEALDCRVVYALVPVTSLQDTVQRHAIKAAEQQIGYVSQTMALEGQDIPGDRRRDVVVQVAEELIAEGRVWDSPATPPTHRQ